MRQGLTPRVQGRTNLLQNNPFLGLWVGTTLGYGNICPQELKRTIFCPLQEPWAGDLEIQEGGPWGPSPQIVHISGIPEEDILLPTVFRDA